MSKLINNRLKVTKWLLVLDRKGAKTVYTPLKTEETDTDKKEFLEKTLNVFWIPEYLICYHLQWDQKKNGVVNFCTVLILIFILCEGFSGCCWEIRKHCSASLWNTWLWELEVCCKVIQRGIIISDLASHACSKLIYSPMSRKWQGVFPTGQALWNSLLGSLKEVCFLEVCENHYCRVQRCLRLLPTLFQQYLPLACGPVVQWGGLIMGKLVE